MYSNLMYSASGNYMGLAVGACSTDHTMHHQSCGAILFSSGQEQESWPGAKCYCICITSSEDPQIMSTTAWVYIHARHGVILAIPVHKHSC